VDLEPPLPDESLIPDPKFFLTLRELSKSPLIRKCCLFTLVIALKNELKKNRDLIYSTT
jgi:hypothetical protein